MLRSMFRLLVPSVLGLALVAAPGCEEPSALMGAQLNDALGVVSERKDELDQKAQTQKLTKAEKKERNAYRRVNKLTATLFDSGKKPVVRLLAGFAVLDALEKANSDLVEVDLLIADTLLVLGSVASDLRTESSTAADVADAKLKKLMERLIGKGDVALAAAEDAPSDAAAERKLRRANLMFARAMQAAWSQL